MPVDLNQLNQLCHRYNTLRKEGFYWVRVKKRCTVKHVNGTRWIVAEYRIPNKWYLTGYSEYLNDFHLSDIDEQPIVPDCTNK
jgi:hypothetical protein